MLNFHYSKDKSKEADNQAILSSGFLSAIVSFSKEARSDIIDSFSTASELIIFSNVKNTGKQLACVFTKDTHQELAYYLTAQISEELQNTHFIKETTKSVLDTEEKRKFREKIVQIGQKFIGSDSQRKYLSSYLKEHSSVNLAILINPQKKEIILHHAVPSSFFNDEYVKDLKLFATTINNAVSKLKLGEMFTSIGIDSKDYSLWIKSNELFISLVYGKSADKNMLSDISSIMISVFGTRIKDETQLLKVRKRGILKENGKLDSIEGESYGAMDEVFLSLIINNLNRIFTKISTKKFQQCLITTNLGFQIGINREKNSERFDIEIKLEQ